MDLSSKGLRTQALRVFGCLNAKGPSLPLELTEQVKANGEKAYNSVNLYLNDLPFLKQYVSSLIAYNKGKTNKSERLGLFVVLFVDQCNDNGLLDENVLRAQTMCSPEEAFHNLRLPFLPPHMENVPAVLVRVEIYLTQQGDTNTWDYRALDPDSYITHRDDMDSFQRRIAKETGIPKELLQKLRTCIAETHPGQFDDPEIQREANNRIMTMMRSCQICKKFGMTLSKCSGCKKVYYCSTNCQTIDWRQHKKVCFK
jgi:hypothetical protein